MELTAADVSALRDAGVADDAIVDAVYVCVLFNLIDRVADALDFEVLTRERFAARAPRFLREGYAAEA